MDYLQLFNLNCTMEERKEEKKKTRKNGLCMYMYIKMARGKSDNCTILWCKRTQHIGL